MYTIIDTLIDGFELHPYFLKIRDKQILKRLKIDFLRKGEVLATESYDNITIKELERLQKQLLDSIIMNLNIEDSWTKAKQMSVTTRTLGVVNMYKIELLGENEDKTRNIKICFIKSGYRTAESVFHGVSKEKYESIISILSNNSAFNLTCTKQCNAVHYLDLLAIM